DIALGDTAVRVGGAALETIVPAAGRSDSRVDADRSGGTGLGGAARRRAFADVDTAITAGEWRRREADAARAVAVVRAGRADRRGSQFRQVGLARARQRAGVAARQNQQAEVEPRHRAKV